MTSKYPQCIVYPVVKMHGPILIYARSSQMYKFKLPCCLVASHITHTVLKACNQVLDSLLLWHHAIRGWQVSEAIPWAMCLQARLWDLTEFCHILDGKLYGLNLECPSMICVLRDRSSAGGATDRWLNLVDAKLIDGKIHWWIQNWMDYLRWVLVGGSRSLGIPWKDISILGCFLLASLPWGRQPLPHASSQPLKPLRLWQIKLSPTELFSSGVLSVTPDRVLMSPKPEQPPVKQCNQLLRLLQESWGHADMVGTENTAGAQ